jgi:predicted RNA methylase
MGRLRHHSPKYKPTTGAFSAGYHLEMVADSRRVGTFCQAIERASNEHGTFLELGCGSGVFSKYAATKFRKVIAVEKDPVMLEIARSNLSQEIGDAKVELIQGDAQKIASKALSQVDVVFCEMMSTWLIVEPQMNVVRSVRSRLRQKGVQFIPSIVHNTLELVCANFEYFGVLVRTHFTEFTGVMPAESISLPVHSWKVDFSGDKLPRRQSGAVIVQALLSGFVNAVRLRSPIQVGNGVGFSGSDSLMPPTVVPVSRPIHVKAGARVRVDWEILHRAPIETARFQIESV